jgi:glycosyltransferase involved in cell wall biosynthesis
MKIAYIANSRFPSEKAQSDQVMAMCLAFAKLGHDVRLYVPDRKPVIAEDPFVYYGKRKTFGFERVPCIDTLRWPWLGNVALWIQTFTFIRKLSVRLRSFAPDIVYSREPYVFAFGGIPGKKVWESHAVHHSRWAKRFLRALDAIVALTKASKDRLVQSGFSSERILVEPDAVDPALFDDMPPRDAARADLGIATDAFIFLYTGKFLTMNMNKGVDEAIEATEFLRGQGRNVRFVAVGGSEHDMKRYRNDQNRQGVTLLPHVPQQELKRYYAAADALLMPFPYTEHYAYYMSPLKLFEYLRVKLPIIVTDLPSVREIVDERSAFFAQPGDVPSLRSQMERVMDHPEDAARRANVAYELSKRYTWDERARRICGELFQSPRI